MAKTLIKLRAQELRRRGETVTHIASLLSVSKGTVSFWCRDITLSPKQIKNIQENSKYKSVSALLKASERKRTERIERTIASTKIGAEDIEVLSTRDRFMLGLGLYWGEGYKNGNEEFGITNSDPDMITFLLRWLKDSYQVSLKELTARVSINDLHRNRVDTVVRYWSQHTGIPISQFTKTSLIKTAHKKEYLDSHMHFGTLRIKVQKGSALRRRVLGSLAEIKRLK